MSEPTTSDKTTILISVDARNELKSFGTMEDNYNVAISKAVKIAKKFNNIYKFRVWFEDNFRELGFDQIISQSEVSEPNYVMSIGKEDYRIQLETFASDYDDHGHSVLPVDYVFCLVKDVELSVPTMELSLFEKPEKLTLIKSKPMGVSE